MPLLREGIPIGAILIRRLDVRPFSDKQIKLLETFADQAVIAIENVRLFQELQARNRDLTEALEQQTATSEILGVIASSPTDLTPVLETVAKNAAHLCEASSAQVFRFDANVMRLAANYGEMAASAERPVSRGTVTGRAIVERKTIHVHDLDESTREFPESSAASHQARLATPLLREGVPLGVIGIRRTDLRPFTESQIKLLETFANQAVIAIENVRLFQELKESLEQQTATSEILGVIASSPTDIQPVLDTIAESAARVCNANDASIRLAEGNMLRLAAHHGPIPFFTATELPIDRDSVAGRALVDRQLIHIDDLLSVVATEFPRTQTFTEQEGTRTALVVPLMREDVPIGTVLIRRTEVRPFSDKQIALLKTFADQAVIAIENVRLFQELQVRNRDLTEALEQQTATSEILRVIASSPTELQTVMDTIAENAARLCDADDVLVRRTDGVTYQTVAHFGSIPHSGDKIPVDSETGPGRAILERRTIHVRDIQEAESEFPGARLYAIPQGIRTVLIVPLVRDGVALGILHLRRLKVQPFTDNQIALLKTFADQAVIAIENVRLFKELQDRNRDLTEALEQQTATSEILQVIASSPTDIQPVLDAIANSAARLCDSPSAVIYRVDGTIMRRSAASGYLPAGFLDEDLPINRNRIAGRAIVDVRTVHVEDMAIEAGTDYQESPQRLTGTRTALATPLAVAPP